MMKRTLAQWLLVACGALSTAAMPVDTAQVAPADSSMLSRGVHLETVEVYGSRNNFGVASSQMSALTLSKEQILSVPVFLGEPDVLKSIQKLPGVQSGTEGSAGIFVRGGDYDQNYITLDGSAIYNAEHLRGYVSAINPDVVSSINFYRGAFPARYGSRLSSVVDVGIKEGDFERYHGLLSLGTLSSRLQLEGPLWKGRTSFNVAARLSYFDLIAKPVLEHFYDQPSALQPFSNMRYYDITAKVVHKFNERNRLSAVFYYGKDTDNESPTESHRSENTFGRVDVLTEFQYQEDDYRASSNESQWNNLLTSLYFTSFITPNHRLNVNVNYSQYVYDMANKNRIDNKITDRYRLFYAHDETTSLTAHSGIRDLALTVDASLKAGAAHWLRYGVKLSRQWLNPRTTVFKDALVKRYRGGLNYDGDDSRINPKYEEFTEYVDYTSGEEMGINNLALYAEDDFSIVDWLKLNYGLRLSSYFVTGKSYLALEPRLSLRYMISENLSVKASYSRMSQGIHRLVTNSLIMPSDIWVPITKDIPLMKSNLYGLGVNYDWQGFNFAAEAYYKTMDNVLEYRNGSSYFITDQNWQNIVALGKGRSYGFELLVERKVGNTTGWLSYTWSKALRTFDRPGNEINGGKEFYASTDHRHNLSANVSHRFTFSKKVALDLSASWTFQSGRRGMVPYAITYGQSIREYNWHIPATAYGEILFYIAGISVPDYIDIYSVAFTDGIQGVAQPFHTFRDVNDFKLPDTHHLDINASLSVKHRFGESVIGLGIYNVYNHYNISHVYMGYKQNKAVLKGICPFPFMPSISYTHKF
ncbi:MAG: TonB-dependent receptor [Muribaculaceae bacterium]|nr:TonB-dependent receptor [Muribaculaceae bacterium]